MLRPFGRTFLWLLKWSWIFFFRGMFFIHQVLDFKFNGQIYNLFLAAVLALVSLIWYARNQVRFENVHIPLACSLVFIWRSIRGPNLIQTCIMHNSMDEFYTLKG